MLDGIPTDPLYLAWCEAEFKMDCLYDEFGEDFTHPRVMKANQEARMKLDTFLTHPTTSLRTILLKLEIACECEDFYNDVLNSSCPDVAPVAIVGAIKDLTNLCS